MQAVLHSAPELFDLLNHGRLIQQVGFRIQIDCLLLSQTFFLFQGVGTTVSQNKTAGHRYRAFQTSGKHSADRPGDSPYLAIILHRIASLFSRSLQWDRSHSFPETN